MGGTLTGLKPELNLFTLAAAARPNYDANFMSPVLSSAGKLSSALVAVSAMRGTVGVTHNGALDSHAVLSMTRSVFVPLEVTLLPSNHHTLWP